MVEIIKNSLRKAADRALGPSGVGEVELPPSDPKAEWAHTKTDAEMELKGLLRKESDLTFQLEQCEGAEMDALRKGDDRGYKLAHAQYDRTTSALSATRTAADAYRNMLGAMETQGYMGSIVDISKNMAKMQSHLGLNSESMKDAVHTIKEGMTSAEELCASMESISDVMVGDSNIQRQDTHKAELLAKIQAEREVQSFGDKIKDEIKEIE